MTKPLNIVFAGTPEFAADHLRALLDTPHRIIAAYTQPDRPAGRGKKPMPSAVKQLALANDIPVFQPENFKHEDDVAALAALKPDLMVVVAYGLLLPQAVLDIPRFGCLNVHGSILPRWRGAAPIQRALWAGDKVTGVTIMQMDIGLDTGDMLYTTTLDISPTDTSATLYAKLAQQGPEALVKVLADLPAFHPEPQLESDAIYAKKLSKAEALIDWTLPAAQLARNVRAFNPWPVAFFALAQADSTQHIKVWEAHVEPSTKTVAAGTILAADKHGLIVQTGQDALRITRCQLPNKKAMAFADVINARADWFSVGTCL